MQPDRYFGMGKVSLCFPKRGVATTLKHYTYSNSIRAAYNSILKSDTNPPVKSENVRITQKMSDYYNIKKTNADPKQPTAQPTGELKDVLDSLEIDYLFA